MCRSVRLNFINRLEVSTDYRSTQCVLSDNYMAHEHGSQELEELHFSSISIIIIK